MSSFSNLAVKADGSVWMWGWNNQGQVATARPMAPGRRQPVFGLNARIGLPLNLSPAPTPGYSNLSGSSTTGAYFSVESTTNLSAGFSSGLQNNILATPPTNPVTVPMTNASTFYRLKF
jgi:hypothetical protein